MPRYIEGYVPGGTDVALGDGGTGASLSDPNADRILFWDDSAGQVTWLTASTGLTITGTSITSSGGGSTELAYVELTSDVSVTATTEAGAQTILSSGALSFDGSTRICVEIYSALVIAGALGGGNDLICNLWDGATDLNRLAQVRSIAPSGDNVGNGVPIFCRRFLTPSNGSHTFHWKAWRTAANGSISANTTDYLPSYLRITTA